MTLLLRTSLGLLALGQSLGGEGGIAGVPQRTAQFVTFEPTVASVAADHRTLVSLHFHVREGFHINSHTPKSELLMPTSLTLAPRPHLMLAPVEYPSGQPFAFAFQPKDKLDVYAGDVIINVPVTAARGEQTISGTLEYQACDRAACYPPRSLPVSFTVTAK